MSDASRQLLERFGRYEDECRERGLWTQADQVVSDAVRRALPEIEAQASATERDRILGLVRKMAQIVPAGRTDNLSALLDMIEAPTQEEAVDAEFREPAAG